MYSPTVYYHSNAPVVFHVEGVVRQEKPALRPAMGVCLRRWTARQARPTRNLRTVETLLSRPPLSTSTLNSLSTPKLCLHSLNLRPHLDLHSLPPVSAPTLSTLGLVQTSTPSTSLHSRPPLSTSAPSTSTASISTHPPHSTLLTSAARWWCRYITVTFPLQHGGGAGALAQGPGALRGAHQEQQVRQRAARACTRARAQGACTRAGDHATAADHVENKL